MTDEENEAIEYWKTHIEILHWNTQLASEHYIKVLLDLVEKQSKEIEELKKGFKIQEHNYQVAMEEIEQRWTDKIKTKIEEIKNLYKWHNKDDQFWILQIMSSLLEEE